MDRPAWVVLEGCDGVGKSTLARAIAGHLSYEYGPTVLQSLRQHSEEAEYDRRPTGWHMRGLNVVQDRSMLSRIAYQPVLLVPGADRHDLDEARWVMARMSHLVAVLYLHCDEDVLVRRLEERGDSYMGPDQVGPLLKSYWRTMAWWESAGGWVCTIDTTHGFASLTEAMVALSTAPTVELGRTRSSLIGG